MTRKWTEHTTMKDVLADGARAFILYVKNGELEARVFS